MEMNAVAKTFNVTDRVNNGMAAFMENSEYSVSSEPSITIMKHPVPWNEEGQAMRMQSSGQGGD